MKYTAIFIVFSLFLGAVSSQNVSCYSCMAAFIYPSAPNAAANTCYAPLTSMNVTCDISANGYCGTTFELRDGLISSITRDCMNGASDFDPNTTGVPGTDCVSNLTTSGNDTDTTTCYQPCTTQLCNSITDTSFTPCSSTCGTGYCNYFTGVCVCPTGLTGADCTTAAMATLTYRSCAQCNSEVDGATCSDGTYVGTPCPEDDTMQGYCAYTTTQLLLDNNIVRTFVTRGCATQADYTHRDECFFSIPADSVLAGANYIENTCSAVCDTNNCNMGSQANGLVAAPETQGLYCVQCSDTTGAGTCNLASARTLCPSTSTHCVFNATYYLSARTDLSFSAEAVPRYRLLSVIRGCATAAVTTGCTATTVTGSITNVQRYTCQESCTTDGCNTGWPSRPTCVQCATDPMTDVLDGYDRCLSNPPPEVACTFPYEEFCVTRDYHKSVGLQISANGFTRNIQRGCTRVNIGSTCVTQFISPFQPTQNCNYTCTTDGCNQGVFNGFSRVSGSVAFSIIPALVGMLIQFMFYGK